MTVTKLDRGSPMPLWAQLEHDLRSRLDAGEFDERFPTDHMLTDEYAVSRHTVREAIRHLNKTGVLTRERGRGTVVNRSEFEQSPGTLYSLFQSVESTGVKQTSEVRTLELVTDTVAADRLGFDEGAELVLLERLRLAGGAPLAVDRVWLPGRFFEQLRDVDWSRTALYDELAKAYAEAPNQGWERVTPVVPSPTDRAALGLRKADAAFFIERSGSHNNTPIEWRNTVIRGDRFRFLSNWSTGNATDLRPSAD